MAVDKVPFTPRGIQLNVVLLVLVSIFSVVVPANQTSMATGESSLRGHHNNMQSGRVSSGGSGFDSSMGTNGSLSEGMLDTASKEEPMEQDNKTRAEEATKLSSDSPFLTALSPTSTWPTTVTSTESGSTVSTATTSKASPRATSETATTTATGIIHQTTLLDQRTHIVQADTVERVITPLPLIERPPPDASYTSSGLRPAHNIYSGGGSRSQSSSHSPVNDLQVDEKHFLSEIVKNLNKSTVVNTGQVSRGHNTSSMGVNETTQHMPSLRDTRTEPATSTLDTLRMQAGTLSGGGASSGTGSHSRSAAPKTHFHKSDSAMLNYIFDSHVKHRHSDQRFGPHFVQVDDIQLQNSSAVLGGVGLLSCKISQLQDKTVSWVRRLVHTNQMLLLTVAMHTYSSDARFRVDFQYPDDWRLRIENVTKEDEGTYECMISTHPPQAIQTNFYVSSAEVLIVDEQGLPLYEKFYNLDSLLELNCVVNHITMTMSVVHWHHGNLSLNYDATRGGISVGTNLTEDAANSTLWVARLKPADAGNYTCSVGPHLYFTTSVHVLNETLAELHHSLGLRISSVDGLWLLSMCILLQLIWSTSVVGMRERIVLGDPLMAWTVEGQTPIR